MRLALSDRLASKRAHSDSYNSRSVRFEDGKVSLVMSRGKLNSACAASKNICSPNMRVKGGQVRGGRKGKGDLILGTADPSRSESVFCIAEKITS